MNPCATIRVGEKRYRIDSDAIVNVKTSNAEFNEVRVTGLDRMGMCLRVVNPPSAAGGISYIPIKNIISIVDADKNAPYKKVVAI